MRHSACAGLASTTLVSSLLQLGAMGRASAASISNPDDYRALVCVLLAGGNDSFNMLVPHDDASYKEYAATRSDLALAHNALLPLKNKLSDGRQLALHPAMTELQSLYAEDDLAFISNVGTLVEPLTLSGFNNDIAKVPLGLFSHSDQIAQWQTALSDKRSTTGWGGRLADIVSEINSSSKVSMNISLAGSNAFQSGNKIASFSVGSEGAIGLQASNGYQAFEQLQQVAVDKMLSSGYRHLFRKAYVEKLQHAISANDEFANALGVPINFSTPFSNSEFSRNMQMVARTIAARSSLGVRRQTFFIVIDDWDHHDEVLQSQNQLLSVLSRGLNEFSAAMRQLNMDNNVTTFTISDFARTLTSNGRGSDHGWGGNAMVMGAAVNGGKVYGEYPSLILDGPLDTGRGRLIPTLSVDQYFAELALWFGVSGSDLPSIIPNIGRFHSIDSGAPIGFMGIS